MADKATLLKSILDKSTTGDNAARSAAWKAFSSAQTEDDFISAMDALPLDRDTKRRAWFLKFPDKFKQLPKDSTPLGMPELESFLGGTPPAPSAPPKQKIGIENEPSVQKIMAQSKTSQVEQTDPPKPRYITSEDLNKYDLQLPPLPMHKPDVRPISDAEDAAYQQAKYVNRVKNPDYSEPPKPLSTPSDAVASTAIQEAMLRSGPASRLLRPGAPAPLQMPQQMPVIPPNPSQGPIPLTPGIAAFPGGDTIRRFVNILPETAENAISATRDILPMMALPTFAGGTPGLASPEQIAQGQTAAMTPVMPLAATQDPSTFGYGVASQAEGLTSPLAVSMIPALGAVNAALPAWAAPAIKASMAVEAAYGMGNEVSTAVQKYLKGDYEGMREALGAATVDGAFTMLMSHKIGRDIKVAGKGAWEYLEPLRADMRKTYRAMKEAQAARKSTINVNATPVEETPRPVSDVPTEPSPPPMAGSVPVATPPVAPPNVATTTPVVASEIVQTEPPIPPSMKRTGKQRTAPVIEQAPIDAQVTATETVPAVTEPPVPPKPVQTSLGEFYHGSPRRGFDSLYAGSMLTNQPEWASGYTTKVNSDLTEDFTGVIYKASPAASSVEYVDGGLHDAEQRLIDMASRINGGAAAGSLRKAAQIVHAQTGVEAIVARGEDGSVSGVIPLTDTPVTGSIDPVEFLSSYSGRISDNIQRALARHKAKGIASSSEREGQSDTMATPSPMGAAKAAPVETKDPPQPQKSFSQNIAEYGRRLSVISKNRDITGLENIAKELEEYRSSGGPKTDADYKLIGATINQVYDVLRQVRSQPPTPPDVETVPSQSTPVTQDVKALEGEAPPSPITEIDAEPPKPTVLNAPKQIATADPPRKQIPTRQPRQFTPDRMAQFRKASKSNEGGWLITSTPKDSLLVHPTKNEVIPFGNSEAQTREEFAAARADAVAYAKEHPVSDVVVSEEPPKPRSFGEYSRQRNGKPLKNPLAVEPIVKENLTVEDEPQSEVVGSEPPSPVVAERATTEELPEPVEPPPPSPSKSQPSGNPGELEVGEEPPKPPAKSMTTIEGDALEELWDKLDRIKKEISVATPGTEKRIKLVDEYNKTKRLIQVAEGITPHEFSPLPPRHKENSDPPKPKTLQLTSSKPIERAREARASNLLDKKINTQEHGAITWRDYIHKTLESGGRVEMVMAEDPSLRRKLQSKFDTMDRGFNIPWGNDKHPKTIEAMDLKNRLAGKVESPEYRLYSGGENGSWTIIDKTKYEYGKKVEAEKAETPPVPVPRTETPVEQTSELSAEPPRPTSDATGKQPLQVDNAEPPKPPVKARDYSSTQVNMPGPLAEKVKALAAKIPDSALAKNGREAEIHTTLKYGLETENAEDVRAILESYPPVRIKLGETSVFEPSKSSDGADVVKIDVDSPGLHAMNAAVKKALANVDTFPDYKPHITLAYVKPGEGKKYAGMTDMEGQEVTLDKVVFSSKSGEKTEIQLKGRPDTEPPTPKSEKGTTSSDSDGESPKDYAAIETRLNDAEMSLAKARKEYERLKALHETVSSETLPPPAKRKAVEDSEFKSKWGTTSLDEEVKKHFILATRKYNEALKGYDRAQSIAAKDNPLLAEQPDSFVKRLDSDVDDIANESLRDVIKDAQRVMEDVQGIIEGGNYDVADLASEVRELQAQVKELESSVEYYAHASEGVLQEAQDTVDVAKKVIANSGTEEGRASMLAKLPDAKGDTAPRTVDTFLKTHRISWLGPEPIGYYKEHAVYPLKDGRMVYTDTTVDPENPAIIQAQRLVQVSPESNGIEPGSWSRKSFFEGIEDSEYNGDISVETRRRLEKYADRFWPKEEEIVAKSDEEPPKPPVAREEEPPAPTKAEEPAEPEPKTEAEASPSEYADLPTKVSVSIPTKAIKSSISAMKKVMLGKKNIPILQNVSLVTRGGETTIAATDLETAISLRVKTPNAPDGATTIPFAALESAAKDKSDAINLSGDGDSATISTGGSKKGIKTMPIVNFPELPKVNRAIASVDPVAFSDVIDIAATAISAEESRFVLNGALLEFKGGKGTMVSTDGHRLSLMEFDAPGAADSKKPLLIPKFGLLTIQKLMGKGDGPMEFAVDDNHFVARSKDGGKSVLSRLLTGSFPDYQRVLPKTEDMKARVTVGREDLLNIAEKAIATYKEADQKSGVSVALSFRDGQVMGHVNINRGEHVMKAKAHSRLEVINDGDNANPRIGFDPRYLKEFLRAVDDDKVEILIQDWDHAAVIRPAGKDNITHIIMPMRIDEKGVTPHQFDDEWGGDDEPPRPPKP